jgi:hypothetical protein
MKANYKILYLMEDPLANQSIRLKPDDEIWLDRDGAIQLLQGQLHLDKPLKLRAEMGRRFTDLIWSTFTPIRVISQRIVDLLNTQGLTGWNVYDVEVRDKEDRIKDGYFGFAISGKAGSHDLRRVEVIEKPPITPKGIPYKVLRGIFFEEDFWDGKDFCLMENNISCVVTEKVVQAFRRAKIRNVHFIQLAQVEIDANVYKVRGMWPIID